MALLFPKYYFRYRFAIDNWNDELLNLSQQYWKKRKFKCEQTDLTQIKGKRGGLWGNFTSFDMKKMLCDLSVKVDANNFVDCQLEIDSIGQSFTEWNIMDFELELIFFQNALLGIKKPEYMHEYIKYRKNANIFWSFSLGLLGSRLSTNLKEKLTILTEEVVMIKKLRRRHLQT